MLLRKSKGPVVGGTLGVRQQIGGPFRRCRIRVSGSVQEKPPVTESQGADTRWSTRMEGIQRNRASSGSHSLSPQHWGLSYQVEGQTEQGCPFTVQAGLMAEWWGREEEGHRGQSDWEHG